MSSYVPRRLVFELFDGFAIAGKEECVKRWVGVRNDRVGTVDAVGIDRDVGNGVEEELFEP